MFVLAFTLTFSLGTRLYSKIMPPRHRSSQRRRKRALKQVVVLFIHLNISLMAFIRQSSISTIDKRNSQRSQAVRLTSVVLIFEICKGEDR